MDVKPGYRQTEVGVIPDEWEVQSLGNVSAITTGRKDVNEGNPAGEYPFFTCSRNRTFSDSYSFDTEAILIAGNGDVGNLHYYQGKFEAYQRTYVVHRFASDVRYIWYQLDYRLVESLGLRKIGTSIPYIKKENLTGFFFPLPADQPEQRAIAEALGDVDGLLAALDAVIAKKRDLKQAAMQQLLTGQTRLPGFSGEWEVKRLGDHVSFLRNGVHSRAELRPDGPVRYVHYGDVHASNGIFMSPTTLPSLPAMKAVSLDRLRDGDLIFADASEDVDGVGKSVELRGIRDTEVVSGLHTIAARFDKTVLADGFKGFLQFYPPFARHLRRLAAGTKVYATNRAHIGSAELLLPPPEEQDAIGTVLSDMDTELAALEARRAKTSALKQGMMQELLTGRTRLL